MGILKKLFKYSEQNNMELRDLKKSNEKGKLFEKLVLGESTFGGEFLESTNGSFLFRPGISPDTLALIEDNNVLWKKIFDNLVSFDFAKSGNLAVGVSQLKKKRCSWAGKRGAIFI